MVVVIEAYELQRRLARAFDDPPDISIGETYEGIATAVAATRATKP
jgi:hypothetical protein